MKSCPAVHYTQPSFATQVIFRENQQVIYCETFDNLLSLSPVSHWSYDGLGLKRAFRLFETLVELAETIVLIPLER